MRRLIELEKPPRDAWDIKLVPGGLIDLEFIAQVAQLGGKVSGEGRETGTAEILSRLSPAFASEDARQELADAFALYTALSQMIRLCITGPFEKEEAPPGLVDLILTAADLPDLAVLEAHLKETAKTVRAHFDRLLGGTQQ